MLQQLGRNMLQYASLGDATDESGTCNNMRVGSWRCNRRVSRESHQYPSLICIEINRESASTNAYMYLPQVRCISHIIIEKQISLGIPQAPADRKQIEKKIEKQKSVADNNLLHLVFSKDFSKYSLVFSNYR